MDGKGQHSLAHPIASANIFSRYVSQSWVNSLLTRGYKQPLDDSDIHEVLQRDATGYLADRLERFWEQEVKTSRKPSLLMPLIKLAGAQYFIVIIYIVIEVAVRTIVPIYIGKVVRVFQDGMQDKTDGYIAATVIALCVITEALVHHPLFLELLRTAMNVRVALAALVYRKALKMSQASLSLTNTGRIINMVTNDVQKTEEAVMFSLYLFVAPFVLSVVCYLIWNEIGYSFAPGMLLLFLITPFQSWLGRFFASLRAKAAIVRDERIKIMNEVICGMRVIKMYTWENPFSKLVGKVRKKEAEQILKTSRLYSLNSSFYLASIPLVTLAMFLPYVLTGNTLTSEKVFVVVAIISSVNVVTAIFVPKSITALKESSVSLRRIQNFLLLDEGQSLLVNKVEHDKPIVVVEKVHSSWDKKNADHTLTDVSFEVSAGELLMVVGRVGCGKSSLLMALLRELPVTSGSIRLNGRVAYVSQQPWVFSGTLRENILFGKKYDKETYDEVIRICALEKDIKSLLNGDETLVGERGVSLSGGQKARVNLARAVYFDADIYLLDDPLSAVDSHVSRHIFSQCVRGALKSKVCILVSHQLQFLNDADRILCLHQGKVAGYGDFESLKESGVDILSITQVKGENDDGDSLSKENLNGQERIVLRSKLDRQLSYSPQNRRRRNNLLKDHDTRSLHLMFPDTNPLLAANEVTLNDQFQAKSAHDLGRHAKVLLGTAFLPVVPCDRKLKSASSIFDVDSIEREEILSQEDVEELAETRTTGSVSSRVYKDYFLAGAGPAMILFCCVVFVTGQASLLVCEWWLAQWSDWEESALSKNDSRSIIDEKRNENISIYVGLVFLIFAFAFLRAMVWFHILINSSRHLHDKMFKAILRAPIYFFDTNPSGRILNRFSKDIGLMDDMLPIVFFDAAQLLLLAFAIVMMSITSQPYTAILVVPILVMFVWLRQYFVKSSREIKRLEALSRSPLYSHISATLQGLATIRASEEQPQFLSMYDEFQDHNSSAFFYYLAVNRWLGFRLDFLCATLMTVVAFAPFLAYEAGLNVNPVLVGLSLLYTKRLSGMFQFCVRQTAEVENQMVSVERVQEYIHIEPEAELKLVDKMPPDDWPEHGEISGENVRFHYHSSLPAVLKDISFNIKAMEKVGIVGRTGAGKSSLISALFRMAEPSGVLKIDGLSITDMGLHDLRGRLSIIPQDPVIFGGSVRRNLDPFSHHKDVELWDALQQVQLKDMVDNFPEKLEFLLTESGSNLSVGQRQLICLARAILKHNKILIIDEATANVDHKTDNLIQETIRQKFKDCTVLTIAHRLNTIMDADRIMVLDTGKVVEFEEPYKLLQRPDSEFSKMVRQTGKETALQLQRMARIAHEKRECQ